MDVRSAVEGTLLPADEFDADLEMEFDALREGLSEHEKGGEVRVFKLPLDEKGNPMANSRQQELLFVTPVGAQSLDDIYQRVKREFIRKDEYRICIKLIGTKPGIRGNRFNRIVFLAKPNDTGPAPTNGPSSEISAILDSISRTTADSNRRMDAMMQRMLEAQMRPVTAQPSFDPVAMVTQMVSVMAVMQKMMAPAGMGAVVAAPVDPLDQLTKFAAVIPRLAQLANGTPKEEGSGMSDIIKAVAPAVGEFLKMANQNNQNNKNRQPPAQLPRRPAPSRPAPAVTPAQEVEAEVKQTVADATGTPVTQPEENDMNLEAVKKLVSGLIEIAQTDPGCDRCYEAAKEILQEVPDDFDDQIQDLVSSPTTYKIKLSFVDARTNLYTEWFEKFRVAVASAYENTQDDDDHTP